jgi:hypothetical protein
MKHIYILISLFSILYSCQEDITPSWLAIESVDLTTNETTEGVNTHSIVDTWVFIDNQAAGVWGVPFRMPVLEEGEHEVFILPGIRINGRSSTRVTNSFYEPYTAKINLTKEETTTIVPNFKYKSVCNFISRDDFEDTGIILNPRSSEDSTKIELISKSDFPNIVLYGNNCGHLTLTPTDTLASVYTELNLPILQTKMYLEFDYLTTNSFAIGIINKTSGGVEKKQALEFGILRTIADEFKWKKIYFDISNQINLNPFAETFELYITSILDKENTEAHIYIDNIKIVYI